MGGMPISRSTEWSSGQQWTRDASDAGVYHVVGSSVLCSAHVHPNCYPIWLWSQDRCIFLLWSRESTAKTWEMYWSCLSFMGYTWGQLSPYSSILIQAVSYLHTVAFLYRLLAVTLSTAVSITLDVHNVQTTVPRMPKNLTWRVYVRFQVFTAIAVGSKLFRCFVALNGKYWMVYWRDVAPQIFVWCTVGLFRLTVSPKHI